MRNVTSLCTKKHCSIRHPEIKDIPNRTKKSDAPHLGKKCRVDIQEGPPPTSQLLPRIAATTTGSERAKRQLRSPSQKSLLHHRRIAHKHKGHARWVHSPQNNELVQTLSLSCEKKRKKTNTCHFSLGVANTMPNIFGSPAVTVP